MTVPARAPARRDKGAERVMKSIWIDFASRDRATLNQEELLEGKDEVFQEVKILWNGEWVRETEFWFFVERIGKNSSGPLTMHMHLNAEAWLLKRTRIKHHVSSQRSLPAFVAAWMRRLSSSRIRYYSYSSCSACAQRHPTQLPISSKEWISTAVSITWSRSMNGTPHYGTNDFACNTWQILRKKLKSRRMALVSRRIRA